MKSRNNKQIEATLNPYARAIAHPTRSIAWQMLENSDFLRSIVIIL